MAVSVYDNCYTGWHRCSTNARDKDGTLHGAYPDSPPLASHTRVADIDVIVARGQIGTCPISQCDVKTAGYIVAERLITHGGVLVAGLVPTKRPHTVGHIEVTSSVENKRLSSRSRVVAPRCVDQERIPTGGRVAVAACVVPKRSNTRSRVV